jgi:hypothetical protein
MNTGFQDWWSRIDILLHRLLVFLFAVFLISQAVLLNQTLKTFISRTDKLEGKSIADSQLFIKKGEIEISVDNYSSLSPLVFYVNGESIKPSGDKTIKLQVKENDVIEVSGAEYGETLVLKVTGVSEDIMVPELGKLIYVNNNLVMIDRVRLKQ